MKLCGGCPWSAKKEGAVLKKMQTGMRSLAVLCLAAVFLLVPRSAALALKLTIRNDFADSLNTAVVYYCDSTGAWTTRGWYVVRPRESRTINFSTSKPTMYLHSYLSGRNKISWGKGDITRVVMSKAFVYEDGETCPAGPGRRTVKFTKYAAKNGLVNYRPVKDGLAFTAANVVNLINNERTRSGLTPLATGETLSNAALTRAREMNVKFDIITRPDGRKFDTALRDNGLVFAGAMTSGVDTPEANALEIFQEFYGDGKTRNSMLDREYTHVGAGICRLGGGYYTVLLFAGGGGSGTTETGLAGAVKDLEQALQGWEDLERAIRQLGENF